jgi:hypothetical protein
MIQDSITYLKHLLKKYFWKVVFRKRLFETGRNKNKICLEQIKKEPNQIPLLNVFTTHNEDGILQYILNNVETPGRFFIDIGSNDCINSNCANLAFHHQWNGIFIDGNNRLIERGKHIYSSFFQSKINGFQFINSIVRPATINTFLENLSTPPQIDLLSIDLDGNDYHIWKAIEVIQPTIVIAEVQVEKGMQEFIPEYDEVFEQYEAAVPKGASPLSMIQLAASKGYELAATNTEGFNLFFVKKSAMKDCEPMSAAQYAGSIG